MASQKLGALSYADEASWGEDSTSFTTRLPVLGEVDLSGLQQESMAPDRVVQYRNDGTPRIAGVMGGGFKLRLYLTGHGSATSGATALTALYTFIGKLLGASAVAAATGTTASGSGTAVAPGVAAATGFVAGGMCRIGSKGDGRGDGQFYLINTHAASVLNLGVGMAAAPSAADVVHSCEMAYTVETPTTYALTGLRFLLQTANQQLSVHGCFVRGFSFQNIAQGLLPTLEIDVGVSWFAPRALTFPSALAVDNFPVKPVSQSSMFLAPVGTATRAGNVRTIRDMSIDFQIGVQPIIASGGVNAYQNIVGAHRVPDTIMVNWSEQADAATTTPSLEALWLASHEQGTAYHGLYTASAVPGGALGFRMPKMYAAGNRPTQKGENGVNVSSVSWACHTGPAVTTDLIGAALIVAGA